jgi:hypothetical protein
MADTADTTQYIVTVNGSPRDGYKSHIEKVILPSGVTTQVQQSDAIMAQVYAHVQKYLKEHPEKVKGQVLIRFIITVKGSRIDGYTAEKKEITEQQIEKLQPLAQPLLQPQVESNTKPVLLRRQSSQAQQKLELHTLELQKGTVIGSIKTATEAAEVVSRLALELYNILKPSMDINENTGKISETAKAQTDIALREANKVPKAIRHAEDAIKATIINTTLVKEIINKTIAKEINNAISESKIANDTLDEILKKIKTKMETKNKVKKVDPSLHNNAMIAQKAAARAVNLWKSISQKLSSSSGGYRNQTYRNHKQHKQRKYNTLRKS